MLYKQSYSFSEREKYVQKSTHEKYRCNIQCEAICRIFRYDRYELNTILFHFNFNCITSTRIWNIQCEAISRIFRYDRYEFYSILTSTVQAREFVNYLSSSIKSNTCQYMSNMDITGLLFFWTGCSKWAETLRTIMKGKLFFYSVLSLFH